MLSPGASRTSTPYSAASAPKAAPTDSISSVSQVEASSVATGNPVAWYERDSSSLRLSAMRTPAGPSASVRMGMPRRGIPCVRPAAPGTFSAIFSSSGSSGGIPGRSSFMPIPTRSFAFSSVVMAAMMSWTLLLPSCGGATAGCAWTMATPASVTTVHQAARVWFIAPPGSRMLAQRGWGGLRRGQRSHRIGDVPAERGQRFVRSRDGAGRTGRRGTRAV